MWFRFKRISKGYIMFISYDLFVTQKYFFIILIELGIYLLTSQKTIWFEEKIFRGSTFLIIALINKVDSNHLMIISTNNFSNLYDFYIYSINRFLFDWINNNEYSSIFLSNTKENCYENQLIMLINISFYLSSKI